MNGDFMFVSSTLRLDVLMNDSVRARHARLLRRLTMTVGPEEVEAFDDASPGELVEAVIDADAPASNRPDLSFDADFWEASRWWLDRMGDPGGGFEERMLWFWHGHLTSSIEKAGPTAMLDQLELLRRHARGSFRDMLREIATDAAMLLWLDGSGSQVDAPNENLARELMELFALGRESGVYGEADVRAAAKALAGYWVDEERDDPVVFDPDSALRGTVSFLGRRVGDVDGVVDTVCDRPECARFVTAALHRHFVGGPIDARLHDRMIEALGRDALDIDAALRVLLLDPAFLGEPTRRPLTGIEWFLAVQQLVLEPLEFWSLESMAHVPLSPPDVSGWPGPERWASSGLALVKAQIALDSSWDTDTLDRTDPVTDVLRRAVLYEVSPTTRSTLDDLAGAASDRRQQASLLHAAVAMCPEFSLT